MHRRRTSIEHSSRRQGARPNQALHLTPAACRLLGTRRSLRAGCRCAGTLVVGIGAKGRWRCHAWPDFVGRDGLAVPGLPGHRPHLPRNALRAPAWDLPRRSEMDDECGQAGDRPAGLLRDRVSALFTLFYEKPTSLRNGRGDKALSGNELRGSLGRRRLGRIDERTTFCVVTRCLTAGRRRGAVSVGGDASDSSRVPPWRAHGSGFTRGHLDEPSSRFHPARQFLRLCYNRGLRVIAVRRPRGGVGA